MSDEAAREARFYDEKLHGLDWPAVIARFRPARMVLLGLEQKLIAVPVEA